MNLTTTTSEPAAPVQESWDVLVIGGTAHPRRTWDAWQRRRRNIRDLGPLAGENIVEAK